MDMSKEAIDKIESLVEKGNIVRSGDRDWSTKDLKPVIFNPMADTFTGYTLKSLADYISKNIDELEIKKYFVQVFGVEKVRLVSHLIGVNRKRETPVEVILDPELEAFPFERFMSQEEFIIKFRSGFQPQSGDDFEELLQMVKKVSGGTSIELNDDGITQAVAVARGASGTFKDVKSPKPIVRLAPYRTFRDIDQVESEFLFRIRLNSDDVPTIALFEADGGRWRNEAANRIEEFLLARLPDLLVLA